MTRPGIYFGYRTALQILRATGVDELRAKGRAGALPSRSPSVQEVAEAVMLLERVHPGLRIERPAHILVGGSSRCRSTEACRPHRCSMPLSSGSFYSLGSGLFAAAPPLAYVHMATQVRDRIALLELGYELAERIGRNEPLLRRPIRCRRSRPFALSASTPNATRPSTGRERSWKSSATSLTDRLRREKRSKRSFWGCRINTVAPAWACRA